MKKREWSKPEVLSLGVSKTTLDDKVNGRNGYIVIYVCAVCDQRFRTSKLADEHVVQNDGHSCYTLESPVELS